MCKMTGLKFIVSCQPVEFISMCFAIDSIKESIHYNIYVSVNTLLYAVYQTTHEKN